MKIVIEVPDKLYNKILNQEPLHCGLDLEWFIMHGTTLEEILSNLQGEVHSMKTSIPDVQWDGDYATVVGMREVLGYEFKNEVISLFDRRIDDLREVNNNG